MPTETHYILRKKGIPSGIKHQINGLAPTPASDEELITKSYTFTQPLNQAFWKIWSQS